MKQRSTTTDINNGSGVNGNMSTLSGITMGEPTMWKYPLIKDWDREKLNDSMFSHLNLSGKPYSYPDKYDAKAVIEYVKQTHAMRMMGIKGYYRAGIEDVGITWYGDIIADHDGKFTNIDLAQKALLKMLKLHRPNHTIYKLLETTQ